MMHNLSLLIEAEDGLPSALFSQESFERHDFRESQWVALVQRVQGIWDEIQPRIFCRRPEYRSRASSGLTDPP